MIPRNFPYETFCGSHIFTYEHKNTADLFLEMRKSSISLAIVLDEYGVTKNLFFKNFWKKFWGKFEGNILPDKKKDYPGSLAAEFYVLGSANLNDVSEALSLHFTSDDYDTIGGYCLGLLDHLPEKK